LTSAGAICQRGDMFGPANAQLFMPYSLDQLEFLSVHMGVAVPPQVLEKKRGERKTAEPEKGAPKTSPEVSLVALQQVRLAWDQTRKQIQMDLKTLEASIIAACQDDPEVGSDNVEVGTLQSVLVGLDDRLIDKLDEALSASEPAQRARLNQEAKAIAGEYMTFINGNALMADIDDSGFTPVSIRKGALSALTLLSSKL
jgi:hypothetical protein